MTEETASDLVLSSQSFAIAFSANPLQSKRWKPLTVPTTFFDDCNIHAFNYIAAENANRMLYCFGCESIEFLTPKSAKIWFTRGDGEMVLPMNVMVYIRQGKSKVVW